MSDIEKRLRELLEAYDSGNVEMNSPELDGDGDSIPPHPWHEEWLYLARQAVAASPVQGESAPLGWVNDPKVREARAALMYYCEGLGAHAAEGLDVLVVDLCKAVSASLRASHPAPSAGTPPYATREELLALQATLLGAANGSWEPSVLTQKQREHFVKASNLLNALQPARASPPSAAAGPEDKP